MNPLDNTQREELRTATLEYLAARHPAAFPPRAIRRTVEKEVGFAFTDDDLTSALEYLKGDGLTGLNLHPLGATPYWHATTAGVRQVERG